MKKIFFLTVYSVMFAAYAAFAQVPADSLRGSYVGKCHYKVQSTDPWIVAQQDTVMISFIDTINCKIGITGCGWVYGQLIPLYSSYTCCIASVPVNYYARFYSMDSIVAIADSNTIPPPMASIFSFRFYGKRINNNMGMGFNEMQYKKPILVIYPNPSNTILFVEYKMFNGIIPMQITDVAGQEIENKQMTNSKMQMDISNLANGVYFVNLETDEGILTRKIVVQR